VKPIDERFKVLLDRLGLGTIHPTPSADVELPLYYKLPALTLTPRCTTNPNYDPSAVPYSRIEQILRKYFDMRVAAGHTQFTYDEFLDSCHKGTLPKAWTY